jgi:hypothetical protein
MFSGVLNAVIVVLTFIVLMVLIIRRKKPGDLLVQVSEVGIVCLWLWQRLACWLVTVISVMPPLPLRSTWASAKVIPEQRSKKVVMELGSQTGQFLELIA